MKSKSEGAHKYARAAGTVRGQIADGTLKPGAHAPSAEALARITGYSLLTCRRALQLLVADGVLVRGPRPNSPAHVAGPGAAEPAGPSAVPAELPAVLAARRHAAGLTQTELASATGYSTASVANAETGRAQQSRRFWERADDALGAGGELLRLFGARRTAAPPAGGPADAGPVCVLAVWADGSAAVLPPGLVALVASHITAGGVNRGGGVPEGG
jgi:DNA-binding transcriptional MocR family regulator